MGVRTPVVGFVVLFALCAVERSDRPVRAEPLVPTRTDTEVAPDPAQGLAYICPMDPDIRSHNPGTCRRCGMTLVAGVPDPVEFHLATTVFPTSPAPGGQSVLQFAVHDPWKDRPVRDFNLVHEKLFHAFVVSQDLQFFEHGHPSFVADGVFQYPIILPKAGMYRVLGDFYPAGATPQLAGDTVFVAGEPPPLPSLGRDYAPKADKNLRVSLTTVPDQPVATNRTQMRFVVEGEHGLEKYLGVWGHALIASRDLIDMMHEHPFLADGGPRVEFEVVFPRPGAYRIWVQFQSDGLVNTTHFDIPVARPDDGHSQP